MEPTLSVYTSRLPQMGLVFLNLNNPSVSFLQNEKIRHALLLGINREHHCLAHHARTSHCCGWSHFAGFMGLL